MVVSTYQKARIFLVLVLFINANIKTQCELDTQCVVLAMNTSTVITVKNHPSHCKTYLGKVPIKQRISNDNHDYQSC